MSITNEDKKDISSKFGKKTANVMSNVTKDYKSKALDKAKEPSLKKMFTDARREDAKNTPEARNKEYEKKRGLRSIDIKRGQVS